jgi:hypothetical protein
MRARRSKRFSISKNPALQANRDCDGTHSRISLSSVWYMKRGGFNGDRRGSRIAA